ncbi:MAG: TetR family transcriptional regulator [Pseudomonas sp.]|jgi:AcrR family transcriptional regulator|uniref:TetR/AcrR family transcriptional regulator n=1 Tax=Pseudomonas sp. TaxID=306 RepID=UPI002619957A|nr:TetR/AcrR family transcriptional regulator [Pseudomonas sp.]MDB6049599.1 TetR family transcriptional regulator [Pseudomonas sp.]
MNQHIPTVADWPHESDVSGDRHALRAQRTRELMLVTMYHLALEKDYCDITVQDLLDRSGVARSTFYTHFRDKEDLLVAGYGVMGAPAIKLTNVADREQVVLDVCGWLFVATEQHAALTTSLMGGTSREIVLAHLENMLVVQVREHMKKHNAYDTNGLRGEIAVRSLVGGLLALWLWWVRHDYPCAALGLSETFNALMSQGIWPISA